MGINTRKPSNLRIAFWNANSILNKKMESETFIQESNIDIMLVSETFLRQCHNFNVANYITYRKDRNNCPGGGTATIIKRNIQHFETTTPELQEAEANSIMVCTQTGNIRIISFYSPGARTLLAEDLNALTRTDTPTIIAGDFNAKSRLWNSRTINSNGRVLARNAEENGYLVLGPDEPTHFTAGAAPEVIDVAILKNITHQFEIQTIHDLSSDHFSVILFLGDPNTNEQDSFSYKKTNWLKYNNFLQQNNLPCPIITNKNEITTAIINLEEDIKRALQHATQTITTNIASPYDIPTWVKDLIREKRRERKTATLTRDPFDIARANALQHEVKHALNQIKNHKWEQTLDKIEQDEEAYWRLTIALRTKKTTISPLQSTNSIVYTDSEKAAAFATHLERQCALNRDPEDDIDWEEQVENTARRICSIEYENHIRPATFKEITEIIKYLPTKKASGPDEIGNIAIKHLPKKSITTLLTIINAILKETYFPPRWKRATVIMIPKTTPSSKFPQDFKPISLISAMSKIAERIILTRLKEKIQDHNILPDEQFGFRKDHSTELQVARMIEYATTAMSERKSTAAILLDVSKAFDRVWHEGLIFKMARLNFNLQIIKLIYSHIHCRNIRVRVNQELSEEIRPEAGVPQGSVLSPTLYLIYTSDIPKNRRNHLAIYADDTAIYTKSKSHRTITQKLQQSITEIEEWLQKWKIKTNPAKTQAILITRKRKPPVGQVLHNNQRINWVPQVKYLGITIDRRLTWNTHITNKIKEANKRFFSLYSIIGRNSNMFLKNKLKIYKSIIRTTLTYAPAPWCFAAQTHLNKLESTQSKFLRIMTNLPWFVLFIERNK